VDEESIFAAALGKVSPVERLAFLAEACNGDADLRARIEALLHAHENPDSFLEPRSAGVAPTADEQPIPEHPGTVIGPYKLIEPIGEGGFGIVFMAEQRQPLRRKVALKVIKPGMDSRQVVARFEAERQALALMDHPNIAHVLDAGATDAGRPYFVMELVKGVPLTQFCDDHRRTTRQRLELFVDVCRAVQHAHQKGVIHRDLKPTNVLVTLHDGTPVPKIIDFGIAKAIGQPLTDMTLVTGFMQMIGTPVYMSPEQAGLSGLDVDTRSDVYSLGVVLYELLTGTTPFATERLLRASYDEVLRIIREEEPLKPSTRISTLGQAAPTVAEQRQVELKVLCRLLRGELDWIVLKALEKDRTRRYATAQELADDLKRFLEGVPIQARPVGQVERLWRWCRRNPAPAAAGVLAVVALAATTALAVGSALVVQLRAARDDADAQRAKAEHQERFARHYLYGAQMNLAQRALESNHTGLLLDYLERHRPRQATDADLRGFEWYYLWRQSHSELLTLSGHTGEVTSVAYSPDGQWLASGSVDGTVKVWDLLAGRELRTLNHTGRVTSVHFSPDGKRLASGSTDRTARIWHLPSGQELHILRGHKGTVGSVHFSPDGKRLATGSGDETVKVWDAQTGGEAILTLEGHTSPVYTVVFSPDGKRLASGTADSPGRLDRSVKVWDAQTGQGVLTLKDAGATVVFSPDGKRLASCGYDSSTVKVWDAATGQDLHTIQRAPAVWGLAFSPDGQQLALGDQAGAITLWDAATGQQLRALRGHAGRVHGVAFSPDGRRLASGSLDRTVKFWDPAAPENRTLKSHTGMVYSVAFRPDGKRLASVGSVAAPSLDRTRKVWLDGQVKVWDTTTGEETLTFKGPPMQSLAFSPDGQRLATGAADETVKVWEAATGRELFSLPGQTGIVGAVAFSPDGHRLASATKPDPLLPDPGKKKGVVKVWDLTTRQEVLSLPWPEGGLLSLAYSPDGRRLAGAGDYSLVRVWEANTGDEVFTLRGHEMHGWQVAFSPDGRQLASSNHDGTVRIWDMSTGAEVHVLRGHAHAVMGVAFSPDGQRLASGGDDGMVKLWDALTGQELLTLQGHTDDVRSVAFSPDGRHLASGSRDKTVKLWDAPPLPAPPGK
jgi:WD40 repeat protein/serine/threonine protein kinase